MCATKEVERKNGEDTEDLRQPCTHGPITVVWKLLLVAVRFNEL